MRGQRTVREGVANQLNIILSFHSYLKKLKEKRIKNSRKERTFPIRAVVLSEIACNAVHNHINKITKGWNEMVGTKIEIPEIIYRFYPSELENDELRRNALLLYPFVANLTISHGKAAEILGITKWSLIELYSEMGFPYFASVDAYKEDLETLHQLEESCQCL